MSHDSDMPTNGNGHTEELDALESAFGEQAASLSRLIGAQERFQAEVVKDVSAAVAEVLETRLVPLEQYLLRIESKVESVARAVAELTQAVVGVLRRP